MLALFTCSPNYLVQIRVQFFSYTIERIRRIQLYFLFSQKCSDFGVWQRQLLFEAEECLYHISCRNGKRVLVTKCEASNPKNSSPRSKNSKPKQKKGTPTSKSSTSNSQKPSGDAVAKKKEQFLKEAKSNVAKLASIGRKQSEVRRTKLYH